MRLLRGNVHWYAGPATAAERKRKRRPVLILSTNAANANELYPYVGVAPITSNTSRIYPLELELRGLDRPSKVQPQNMFTCLKVDLSQDILLTLEPELMLELAIRLKQYLDL